MSNLERWGHTFELAPKVGQLPLWRFGKLAKAGKNVSEMDSYAAMYDLLESCFTPAGWEAFEACPEANAADEDELLEVLAEAMKAITARPTGRPSDSSDGSPVTSVNSTVGSSSPVIDRLVEKGRPDLALIVTQAEESRALVSA